MITTKIMGYALAVMTVAAAWGWGLAITRGADRDVGEAKLESSQQRTDIARQGVRDANSATEQVLAVQQECNRAMETVRRQGEEAAAQAQARGEQIGREREAYARQLDNADQLPGCEAVTQVRVCPELMNY